MNLFVWELGGEVKRVCVYFDFPLQGETDRNDEFVCMGVGDKRVCLLYFPSHGREGWKL